MRRLDVLESRAPGTREIATSEDVTANQLFTLRISDKLSLRLAAVEAALGAGGDGAVPRPAGPGPASCVAPTPPPAGLRPGTGPGRAAGPAVGRHGVVRADECRGAAGPVRRQTILTVCQTVRDR